MTEKEEQQHVGQDVTSGSTVNVDTGVNVDEPVNPEKPSDKSTTTVEDGLPEHEYVTGVKLLLVVTSVTLVAFLMMLDMSIIVTVGLHRNGLKFGELLTKLKGYSSNHYRLPLSLRCGLVRQRISSGKVSSLFYFFLMNLK